MAGHQFARHGLPTDNTADTWYNISEYFNRPEDEVEPERHNSVAHKSENPSRSSIRRLCLVEHGADRIVATIEEQHIPAIPSFRDECFQCIPILHSNNSDLNRLYRIESIGPKRIDCLSKLTVVSGAYDQETR